MAPVLRTLIELVTPERAVTSAAKGPWARLDK